MREAAGGTSRPYELNVSLFDALSGTVKGKDEWNIGRFLCGQAIAMALEGIPAFYIHSLLATPNDLAGVEKTNHNRAINRHRWHYPELLEKLADPSSQQAIVFAQMKQLIAIRRNIHCSWATGCSASGGRAVTGPKASLRFTM